MARAAASCSRLQHARLAWELAGSVTAGSGNRSVMRCATDSIHRVAWSPDGELCVSHSGTTVRLWRPHIWQTLHGVAGGTTSPRWACRSLFPHVPRLSTLATARTALHLWHVDETAVVSRRPASSSVRYTTVKSTLVGEGALGLGDRLAQNRFQIMEATHGQQCWMVEA